MRRRTTCYVPHRYSRLADSDVGNMAREQGGTRFVNQCGTVLPGRGRQGAVANGGSQKQLQSN